MGTKSPLKPEAIKLLRRVKRHILAEPKRYDQNVYCDESKTAPCGTAACIAGWCDVLSAGVPTKARLKKWMANMDEPSREFYVHCPHRAARALGMARHQWDLESDLFSVDGEGWPEPYCTQFIKARTARRRAEVAAARIEHFIKTGD